MSKLKKQNAAGQFSITRQQIIEMAALSKPRDAALIVLMGLNGLRRAEAVSILYSNIDQDKKRLSFSGKGSKHRIVPFDSFTESILEEHIKNFLGKNGTSQAALMRKDFPLFPSRNSATGVLNLNNVNRIIAAAGTRAKIKNPDPDKKYINPHILRHSYAHHLKIKGVPLEVIRDVLGHSSIETTASVYGRRSMDEIQEILIKAT